MIKRPRIRQARKSTPLDAFYDGLLSLTFFMFISRRKRRKKRKQKTEEEGMRESGIKSLEPLPVDDLLIFVIYTSLGCTHQGAYAEIKG